MSVNRKEHDMGCHCWRRRELTRNSCNQCYLGHLSVEGVVSWGYEHFSFYLMSHRHMPDAVMLVRQDVSKKRSFSIIH